MSTQSSTALRQALLGGDPNAIAIAELNVSFDPLGEWNCAKCLLDNPRQSLDRCRFCEAPRMDALAGRGEYGGSSDPFDGLDTFPQTPTLLCSATLLRRDGDSMVTNEAGCGHQGAGAGAAEGQWKKAEDELTEAEQQLQQRQELQMQRWLQNQQQQETRQQAELAECAERRAPRGSAAAAEEQQAKQGRRRLVEKQQARQTQELRRCKQQLRQRQDREQQQLQQTQRRQHQIQKSKTQGEGQVIGNDGRWYQTMCAACRGPSHEQLSTGKTYGMTTCRIVLKHTEPDWIEGALACRASEHQPAITPAYSGVATASIGSILGGVSSAAPGRGGGSALGSTLQSMQSSFGSGFGGGGAGSSVGSMGSTWDWPAERSSSSASGARASCQQQGGGVGRLGGAVRPSTSCGCEKCAPRHSSGKMRAHTAADPFAQVGTQ